MMNQLTIPMMIIGLKPFRTFRIDKNTKDIVMIDENGQDILIEVQ